MLDDDFVRPAPKNVGGRPRSAGTNRQVALRCDSCEITLYTTPAMARKGMPTCQCGFEFEPRTLQDRYAIDPAGVEEEFWALGRVPFNDAMRELGRRDLVIPDGPRDSHSGEQRRCDFPGCVKFSSDRYCREHEKDRPAMGSAYKGR